MTDDELAAYARGYLDGWHRCEQEMATAADPEGWAAAVRRWRIESETALHRKLWDAAVRRGENPTPHEHEEPSCH